jgi:hypothetical protein
MNRWRLLLIAVPLFLTVVTGPAHARRDTLGMEWWFGGGFHNPDYHDGAMVLGRGGLGLVVLSHVTLGANAQVDRDHWFGFGYAGAVLPAFGSVEPYARFHYGRRDDSSASVKQWTAGVRYGIETVKFYVEVFGIIEPGDDLGACFGITF